MTYNMPDPTNVTVEDVRQLIENLPDEKRQQLLSQLDVGPGAHDLGVDDVSGTERGVDR